MKTLRMFSACCLIAVTLHTDAQDQCSGRIAKLTRQADTVVVAEVTDAGRSPGFWSGQITAQQRITYRVNTVLKGEFKVAEFSVDYYVVHGSRLSEKETPQLSRALFTKGNKLLLFLHSRTVRLPDGTTALLVNAALDEDCSVLLPSAAAIKAVQRAGER